MMVSLLSRFWFGKRAPPAGRGGGRCILLQGLPLHARAWSRAARRGAGTCALTPRTRRLKTRPPAHPAFPLTELAPSMGKPEAVRRNQQIALTLKIRGGLQLALTPHASGKGAASAGGGAGAARRAGSGRVAAAGPPAGAAYVN